LPGKFYAASAGAYEIAYQSSAKQPFLGAKMKKYQVFKHPDNRLEAVKTGFSFHGLIFGFFWLFWHKNVDV